MPTDEQLESATPRSGPDDRLSPAARRRARPLGGAGRGARLRRRDLLALLEADPRRPPLPGAERLRPGPRGAARARPPAQPAGPAPGPPRPLPLPTGEA